MCKDRVVGIMIMNAKTASFLAFPDTVRDSWLMIDDMQGRAIHSQVSIKRLKQKRVLFCFRSHFEHHLRFAIISACWKNMKPWGSLQYLHIWVQYKPLHCLGFLRISGNIYECSTLKLTLCIHYRWQTQQGYNGRLKLINPLYSLHVSKQPTQVSNDENLLNRQTWEGHPVPHLWSNLAQSRQMP